MRQPQHNNNNNKNRMRGRGRKPANPGNRNFESNGPEVKIRGNAAHIAEKYSTLARDALSSGDRVIAENYLQHAEHYNRIVMAATAAREEAQAANPRNSHSNNDQNSNPQNAKDDQSSEAESNDATSTDANSDGDVSSNETRRPNNRNARNSTRAPRENARASREDAPAPREEISATNGSESDEEVAEPSKNRRPRRTSRKVETENSESMSEDAAALPQGLFRAGSSDEETVQADD